METRMLTGIKPTGSPHLGNYFGLIRPVIEETEKFEDTFCFVADYHALNGLKDPALLKQYTYEVLATYIACGMNPERVTLYRQSDVPEIFELNAILMNFTEKGLMNRAHAYKAKVAANEEAGKSPDEGVNMGLFTYPILMSADILMFDPGVVPVGADQKQHVEMTRDIAQHVNSTYGKEVLTIPEVSIRDNVGTIVGLDGRKMSKSYGNTIPLFEEEKKLRKLVMKIVTTSQEVEEAKEPEGDTIFTLYSLIASKEEQEALAERYRAGGMGWGDAKQTLFEALNGYLAPKRDIFHGLMEDKGKLDQILADGAAKARDYARRKMDAIRTSIGV